MDADSRAQAADGRKYRVVIAYDGTGYSGWQFQSNAVGIQQVVEEALAWLEGDSILYILTSQTSICITLSL